MPRERGLAEVLDAKISARRCLALLALLAIADPLCRCGDEGSESEEVSRHWTKGLCLGTSIGAMVICRNRDQGRVPSDQV